MREGKRITVISPNKVHDKCIFLFPRRQFNNKMYKNNKNSLKIFHTADTSSNKTLITLWSPGSLGEVSGSSSHNSPHKNEK